MNRDRNTLKGFFTKGAIPSQENFADLIDSAINQNDDGITKLPSDPLRINASGPGDTVLNFYQKATDSKPAWALSLNSGDTSAKAGLNVSSSPGGSRLFIDYNSGNVGIGSFTPRKPLDVNGEVVAVNRLTLAQDTGITTKTWHVDNYSGLFRLFWQQNINTVGTAAVVATTDGDVGIGTDKPAAKLDVANGILHVAGQVDPTVTQQGAYLGWNTLSGSTGETDFINNQGQGSGGFAFMNTPESGTPRKTLMFIAGDGALLQHAPMIQCNGRGDWDNPNHPLQNYFREKLAGQDPGTMLCVMADFWVSVPHYWIGCVCADKKAYMTVLRPGPLLGDARAL
jgi:hypothetical protein